MSRHVPKTAPPHIMARIQRERERREARAREEAEWDQAKREAHARAAASGIRVSISVPLLEDPQPTPPSAEATPEGVRAKVVPHGGRKPPLAYVKLRKEIEAVCPDYDNMKTGDIVYRLGQPRSAGKGTPIVTDRHKVARALGRWKRKKPK